MDNEQQSIDFYENEATIYDERRWSSPAGRYTDKVQKYCVLDLVGNCESMRVLDIATGTGRFALELAKCGANVTVLDSSKSMLDVTFQRFAKEGLSKQLRVRHSTATELPFDDGTFDVCTCINALNHIEGYSKVLDEIHRVLKHDGISVTSYTNWLSPYLPFGLWVNLRKKSVTRDVYTKWFNTYEILSLHRKHGFKIDAMRGGLHLPTNANQTLSFLRWIDGILRKRPLAFFGSNIFVKASKGSTL